MNIQSNNSGSVIDEKIWLAFCVDHKNNDVIIVGIFTGGTREEAQKLADVRILEEFKEQVGKEKIMML